MNALLKNIKSKVEDVRLYWKTPPHGRYMPFKEIASLAVGGMGVKFICYAVQLMLLSVGNTLIGNTIGIPPRELYVIYIISVLSGFPLTGIRARMVDNARNKKGRFRPYIFTMAIPTVILAMGFTWMPYEQMNMFWKCFTVLAFNIGFQFFYMMMFDSYTNIINVLSPNTYERSDAYSVTGIVDSFAPTIIGFIMPLLAQWITGQNTIYDMRIYRAVFPPILLAGLLLTIFIYVNTEEKVVQAKTHVIQIKFMDSLRAVAKNKYFWIISLAGWIGFLESSFATILAWLYNYQNACSALEYSIITAIYGNSALWSMIFSPYLVRKTKPYDLNECHEHIFYPYDVSGRYGRSQKYDHMAAYGLYVYKRHRYFYGQSAYLQLKQRYPRLSAVYHRGAYRRHVFCCRADRQCCGYVHGNGSSDDL